MNRFWVFPVVLGVVGALFPLGLIEGIAPMILSALLSDPVLTHNAGVALLLKLPWFITIGSGLGLIAGSFDKSVNGRRGRGGGQLVGNVAWCLLYAHVFIVVNGLTAFCWLSKDFPFGNVSSIVAAIDILAVYLPLFLWLVAILWATIRTITTDDVLSPRVLLGKLKRSTQLSG